MKLANCTECGIHTFVNTCTHDGKIVGELCAYCYECVEHDPAPRNPWGRCAKGSISNDPGFDNVIRAMEEDR